MAIASPPSTSLESLLIEIADSLQLPVGLDQEVRQHYEALGSYIAGSELGALNPSLYAQGSFRIGTTVKPKGSDEFDLDFICEINVSSNEDPADVYEAVARVIEKSDRYGPKSDRKTRCVRVTFANNCHVDIVPAIPDRAMGGTAILIPDPDENGSWSWRSTNPKGYVEWFESKQELRVLTKAANMEPLPLRQEAAEKSLLQIGVQLLKRNHQVVVLDQGLRTPSIVHTTIAGQGVGPVRALTDTFDHIVGATTAYGASPKHILHPANPSETISEKWNNPKILLAYQNYAKTLARQWSDVKGAAGGGYQVVMPLLNEMFGEKPVARALKALTDRTRSLSNEGRLKTFAGGALGATTLAAGNPRKTFFGE